MRSLTKNAISHIKRLNKKPKRYGIYNAETKIFKFGISEPSEDLAWKALKKRVKTGTPNKCLVIKEVLF